MAYQCGIASGTARLRANWNFILPQCQELNSQSSKPNIIVLFITDVVLLLIVLVGLFRLRSQGHITCGIGRLLWKQGVLWLILATLAEVLPMVFIILDLNGPFNLMFQLPSVETLTIAATRMYRSLSDFASSTTDIASDNLPKGGTKVSLKWSVAVPVDRTRVTTGMDITHEQSQPSGTSSNGSYSSVEEQPCEKPQEYEPGQEPGGVV